MGERTPERTLAERVADIRAIVLEAINRGNASLLQAVPAIADDATRKILAIPEVAAALRAPEEDAEPVGWLVRYPCWPPQEGREWSAWSYRETRPHHPQAEGKFEQRPVYFRPAPQQEPEVRTCDCHLQEHQICDVCQGVTGNEVDAEPETRDEVLRQVGAEEETPEQVAAGLMHIVLQCDEDEDEEGFCECGRAIAAAIAEARMVGRIPPSPEATVGEQEARSEARTLAEKHALKLAREVRWHVDEERAAEYLKGELVNYANRLRALAASPPPEDSEMSIRDELVDREETRDEVRALDVLRQVQWSERWTEGSREICRCPVCACSPRQGHRPDCIIGRALASHEPPPEREPVAWKIEAPPEGGLTEWVHRDFTTDARTVELYEYRGYRATPLFALPPAPEVKDGE